MKTASPSLLFKFEWYYLSRLPISYLITFTFFCLGILLGISTGFSFPNIHANSPYQIAYMTGLLSLVSIFTITLVVAQTILRETETKFDQIIFTSPVSKPAYLFSRLAALISFGLVSSAFIIPGMIVGHHFNSLPGDKFGAFRTIHYVWPYLILVVPNVILCTVLLCSTAWLSRNKLIIYITGLLIYVLYIASSIFSGSPLIAGSGPVSAASASLFAKVDPFGLAAFFEQTRYWTAAERNSELLNLRDNLLFNRVLWLLVASVLAGWSYSRFSFRGRPVPAEGKDEFEMQRSDRRVSGTIKTELHSLKHNYQSFLSFLKIDLLIVTRGIPFILILIMLTGLLGIELLNAVDGDLRLGENYPDSGLMVTTIIETVPVFCLLVMLFYSSEILWRSRGLRFSPLEDSTAFHPLSAFVSKVISIGAIVAILLSYSIVLGLAIQAVKGAERYEPELYLSLYYYAGLPLFLCGILMLSVQVLLTGKYTGLAVASVLLIMISTSLGKMIGLTEPLIRYANPMTFPYADMNGFGGYKLAFHLQMLYSAGIAGTVLYWALISTKRARLNLSLLLIPLIVLISAGSIIYYQTYVKSPRLKGNELNDWKQVYESRFKKFEKFPQPSIYDVKTRIDLFPSEQNYVVSGTYRMINRTGKRIDSVLISFDRETRPGDLRFNRKGVLKNELDYGSWYVLQAPLMPGDLTEMNFSFTSGWSGFTGHVPFNSILENGSFIRISNFFPSLGYDGNYEITNSIERRKRGMSAQDKLPALETPDEDPYDYKFINLDAVISTEADQLAIGQGDLVKSWSSSGRRYFHYKTDRPIPFRFAVSSARYLVKRATYRNIPIEVYYDPRHGQNVSLLISHAKKTLEYCEENFGSYPHKSVRFAEISAFAEGFAATAYPGTIYMKENGGFYTNLATNKEQDVINQLAGHELSHQWWGSAQMAPVIKEGGWVMTETLAKYTELMLDRQASGEGAILKQITQNLDLYLSGRSFSKETPLFKTTYETPYLPYNKGMVVMYQLEKLIGERAMNKAFASLLKQHVYPNLPADAEDLVNELYKVAPESAHTKITELFKHIITYDLKVDSVDRVESASGKYVLKLSATAYKFAENSDGKRKESLMNEPVRLAITYDSGNSEVLLLKVGSKGMIKEKFTLSGRPVKIVLDPQLEFIDINPQNNSMEF
ncbi:aminopeptidase [Flavihumibacter sp. R14]|nr:aminopeptidase [Flavihumibacter soli]